MRAGICLIHQQHDRTFEIHDEQIDATILIKMMPSDGRNSVQRHLRESLANMKDYDEFEEELRAELYRREAETDKAGGINQLAALEEIEGEKDKDAK